MIAREWRGVIRSEQVDEYIAYIWATGGGEYGKTPGNRGTCFNRRRSATTR